jgi:hydrogenase nickel incorporation protein HypA/HybF
MHELAICHSLIELIGEQQRRTGFARVRRVVVELGTLGHVDRHALEFAFAAGSQGSAAEGACLEIRDLPAEAWCADCRLTVPIRRRGAPCEHCGGYQLLVAGGDELRLKALEVI